MSIVTASDGGGGRRPCACVSTRPIGWRWRSTCRWPNSSRRASWRRPARSRRSGRTCCGRGSIAPRRCGGSWPAARDRSRRRCSISGSSPAPALDRLLDIARGLLRDNVVAGTAAAIQTYRNLRQSNSAADHDQNLWVYGRQGQPCRKCGTPIEMKKSGLEARPTFWCPSCQRLVPGTN